MRVSEAARSACAPLKPGASTVTTELAANAMMSEPSPKTISVTVNTTESVCAALFESSSVLRCAASTGTVAFAMAPAIRARTRFMSPWATR